MLSSIKTFPVSAFIQGTQLPWKGFQFLNKNPKLWQYGWMPVLINLVLSLFVWWGLYELMYFSLDWIGLKIGDHWYTGIVQFFAGVGLFIFSLGIAFAAWMGIGSIFMPIFYSLLIEKVELKLGMKPEEVHKISLLKEIFDGARLISKVLFLSLCCLLLQWVPGIGTFIGIPLSFMIQSYFFGFEYLDYPLSLRGWTLKEKKKAAGKIRFQLIGLGSIVMLLSWVPIIGPIALTTAVVGASLVYHQYQVGVEQSIRQNT